MSTSILEQSTVNLLLDKMEELRRKIEIKDKEINDLQEENELLKVHLKELIEEKDRYQDERTRLYLQVTTLKEENKALKEDYLKLDLENDTISKDYSHLKQEFDRLKKRVQELEARQHSTVDEVQEQATPPSSRPNEISLTSDDLIDTSTICSPSSGQPAARRQSIQSIDNESPSVITQSLEERSSELSLDVLMRELSDNAADKWRQIGIQLKISSSRLNSIDANHKNDIDKLSDTLQLWLDNDSCQSWTILCDILQSSPVYCSDLAESLRKKYCV